METYHSFRPGQPWKDTEGKLIQTHGGSVLYHEGTYYWYGENKDHYVAGAAIPPMICTTGRTRASSWSPRRIFPTPCIPSASWTGPISCTTGVPGSSSCG